jgi:peptide/nickel transport system ATP-binding protein
MPLVELSRVSKRFVKSLDVSARIGNLLGAGLREEVVPCRDGVDLAILEAKSSGSSANRVRQVDARPAGRGLLALTAAAPHGAASRSRGSPPTAARAQQLKMQMIFQDPYRLAQPADARRRHRRRGACRARPRRRKGQAEYVAQQMNRVASTGR